MNKSELIASVALVADIPKTDAGKAIDSFIEVVCEALKAGDEVKIANFGTFKVKSRAATTGRNPRTGETIDVPASRQVKFKALKALKESVSSSKR